jgi:hypothetical protein
MNGDNMMDRDNNRVRPSDIQAHLRGMDYPANKQELVEKARHEGAPREVVSALNQLPNKNYNSPTDVSREIGRAE